jgi:hypothetical protein
VITASVTVEVPSSRTSGSRVVPRIIFTVKEVAVSLIACRERPCYMDNSSLERSPNIVLVQLSPNRAPRVDTPSKSIAMSEPQTIWRLS